MIDRRFGYQEEKWWTEKHMRPSYPVKIAVLIPCYNEEVTVAEVLQGFKRKLPQAEAYVFDNGSTDRMNQLPEPRARQ